jgi:hypothetical protein
LQFQNLTFWNCLKGKYIFDEHHITFLYEKSANSFLEGSPVEEDDSRIEESLYRFVNDTLYIQTPDRGYEYLKKYTGNTSTP